MSFDGNDRPARCQMLLFSPWPMPGLLCPSICMLAPLEKAFAHALEPWLLPEATVPQHTAISAFREGMKFVRVKASSTER